MARPKILVFQWHDDVIELPPDVVHLEFADGQLDPGHFRDRINDSIHPLMTLSNNAFSRWIERFDL